MLDHVGKIHLVHRGHSAIGMAGAEVLAQQIELFVGRPRAAFGRNQIAIAFEVAALRIGGCKVGRRYTHRNARLTVQTAGAIRHSLTAAKADAAQCFVQLLGMRTLELREHFPFTAARQVRARCRTGHEETRKAYRCCHEPNKVLSPAKRNHAEA